MLRRPTAAGRHPAGERRAGRTVAVVVAISVIVGLGLLSVTWVFSNPPGAAPDEPAALVKALATARLEISGMPYRQPYAPYDGSATKDRWMAAATRSYEVSAELAPAQLLPCMAFVARTDAACTVTGDPDPTSVTSTHPPGPGTVLAKTPDGTYPPAVYLLLGIGARLGHDTATATYGARSASAALGTALIGVAAWCLVVGRRTWWPLVGLLLAATPMVLFLVGSVTTNGDEIAGAICFWAGLLRIRLPSAPRSAWLAMGLGAAVMTAARQLDDAWLLAGAVLLVCLLGPGGLRRAVRSGGWYGVVGIGLAAAAGSAGAAWDVLVSPSQPVSLRVARSAAPTTRGTEELLHQAVGVFGWLDTPLPATAERAWLVAVGATVVVAVAVGTRRARLGLGVALAALAAGTLGIQMLVLAQIGYGMQSRYVLPMAVGVVLLAAEVLDECDALAAASRWVAPAVVGLVAVVQALALDTNAVRYGVGLGTHRSEWTDPAWQPPGGTTVWLVVGLAGVAAIGVAGAAVAVAGRHRAPGRHAAAGGRVATLR